MNLPGNKHDNVLILQQLLVQNGNSHFYLRLLKILDFELIVLLKMFRLTTLFSQLVEWFYLGRKTKIQISQLLHCDMYELSRQVFNSEMSLITVCKINVVIFLYFSFLSFGIPILE